MAKSGRKRTRPRRKRHQRGGKLDLRKAIEKTAVEFHIPSYRFAGPGTHLASQIKSVTRQENEDKTGGQENYASQEKTQIVILYFMPIKCFF